MKKIVTKLTGITFLMFSLSVKAQAVSRMDSADIFDNILKQFDEVAHMWSHTIIGYASWVFWSLALISMVWTFGMMALRKADIQEFLAEAVRFLVALGFFYWLLLNGPAIAASIIDSLRLLAADASGLDQHISPSGIVDVGFDIVSKTIDNSSVWSPTSSLVGMILAAVILAILTLVALNMLIILITGWILTYSGVVMLGFGGGRWTQDIAINYYKTVLGIALQAFAMILLVGIGKSFIDKYYALMAKDIMLKEMFVMFVVALTLLVLINKIPPILGGMVHGGGHGGGGGGGGGLGVGGALGAAGIAGATALAATSAAASQGAGALTALKSAFSAASQSVGQSGGFLPGSDQNKGKIGTLAHAMGQSGKFAGSVGSHLASGAASVAKDKAGAMKDAFSAKVSETTGAKVADAINQKTSSSSQSNASESPKSASSSSTTQQTTTGSESGSVSQSASSDSQQNNVASMSVPEGKLDSGSNTSSTLNKEVDSFVNQSSETGGS